MGVESHYHLEANVSHDVFRGPVTNDEILAAVRAGLARLDGARRRFIINDYTDASLANVSNKQVKTNVKTARNSAEAATDVFLIAIVPGDLEFGMSRMWISYAQGMHWDAEAVRSRAECEQLLRDHGIELDLEV